MEEKESHTDKGQSMSENDKRELWFSALAADDSQTYNVDKAFEHFVFRTKQKHSIFSHIPKSVYGAAVVLLLLVASTISYWWGEQRLQNRFADIIVEAPLGGKTRLILPDSTQVWLNAASRIVYSQGFGVENRNLKLEGEAYFEVCKNEDLPFNVKTRDLEVKVLGTKFDFRNYKEDEEVVVVLMEGKVRLESLLHTMDVRYLEPSEKMVLNKYTGQMTISKTKVTHAKEWTNDRLFFDETPLSDIVAELCRSYDVKIEIESRRLRGYRFYAQFDRRSQTIEEVLETIAATGRFEYKMQGDTIILYQR